MTAVGWHLPDLNAIHELFCLVCCRVPLGGRGEQLHEEPSSVAGGNAGCTAPSTCCSVTVGHSLRVCSSSRPLGNTFCARFGTQHRTLMCPHNAYIAWCTASAHCFSAEPNAYFGARCAEHHSRHNSVRASAHRLGTQLQRTAWHKAQRPIQGTALAYGSGAPPRCPPPAAARRSARGRCPLPSAPLPWAGRRFPPGAHGAGRPAEPERGGAAGGPRAEQGRPVPRRPEGGRARRLGGAGGAAAALPGRAVAAAGRGARGAPGKSGES